MFLFSQLVGRNVITTIFVFALACTFLTIDLGGTWDRASEHIVTVDIYDIHYYYCGSVGYSYYVPDTTTEHYLKYHLGPDWATPPDHPYPHTATITERLQHQTSYHLDTYCDGTYPNVCVGQ